jgi:hypothetical protein
LSFDLFVVMPSIASDLTNRFNVYAKENQLDLQFDVADCVIENGASWFLRASNGAAFQCLVNLNRDYQLRQMTQYQAEIHLACNAEKSAFLAVAALAELSNGLVGDPQSCADQLLEQEYAGWTDFMQVSGLYTPEVTRAVAELTLSTPSADEV